jgi:addiction module HigA family antidote
LTSLVHSGVRALSTDVRRRHGTHTHSPREILGDELEEIGLSAKSLADVIEVPPNRLYQLLAGKRSMTADTALRLSQYFSMSADFWMNLQSAYELDLARKQNGKAIQRIPKRKFLAEVQRLRSQKPLSAGPFPSSEEMLRADRER